MSLALVGGFLAVVGLCDLLRANRYRLSHGAQASLVAVGGVLLVVLLSCLCDSWWGLVLGLGLVVALALWIVGSSEAIDAPDHAAGPSADVWRSVAFAGLGLGVVVSLLGAAPLDDAVAWPQWLRDSVLGTWPVSDVVASAGVLLFQLATGNLLVTLILEAAGIAAITHERTLKGGRLLGPMERIIIVGLGHIGALTAAAIIVAAKGLLQFPELQAAAKAGRSDVTAYVLLSSFASWLIGLGGVALIYLA